MTKIISGGHAAILKALASAHPSIVNMPTGFGTLPIYEAVRLGQPDVVAVLLEFGVDPLHPVQPSKTLGTYRSSLMSHAAFDRRMTEMLLQHARCPCRWYWCATYRCRSGSSRYHAPPDAAWRGRQRGPSSRLAGVDADAFRRQARQSRCHEVAGAQWGTL